MMGVSVKNWSKTALWSGILILLAIALRCTWFYISVNHLPGYDDECKIAIQADDIAHGRSFPLLILASPYIFPLDAYLMAMTTHFLPRGEVGIRTIALLQGLVALLVFLQILRMGGDWRRVWPGVLLVLFPSAYWLMLQCATLLPGYPPMLLLGPLSIWLSLRRPQKTAGVALTTAGAGAASALACSGSMLSLSFLVCAAAASLLQRRWIHTVVAIACFGGAAWLGLLPHRAAEREYAGAFSAVQGTVSVEKAVRTLEHSLLEAALPHAMGLGAPFFPDTEQHVQGYEPLFSWIGWAWLFALGASSVWALWRFIRDWIRAHHPVLTFDQVFIALSWASLILFIFSARSHSRTYRYILPAVMSWPMVLAGAYAYSGRAVRVIVGVVALFFLSVNAHNTYALLREWSHPGFADGLAIYDQKPAIDYLKAREIHHAYATYEDAYRITYATGGEISCGQPYNERFPSWRAPYADELMEATNVAYILTTTGRFPAVWMENDCAGLGVSYRRERRGHYWIYTDFRRSGYPPERKLDPSLMTLSATHAQDMLPRLLDGDSYTRYRVPEEQGTDMWVQVSFSEPQWVSSILLDDTASRRDRAGALNFDARLPSGEWRSLLRDVATKSDAFEWMNEHPVYARSVQTYRFPAVLADAIRISIAKPVRKHEWRISELEVFGPAERVGSPVAEYSATEGVP